MKFVILLLTMLLNLGLIGAQPLDNEKIESLPDGIYSTYLTYSTGVPTNNMRLKKKYINRKAKRSKWLGMCFFHYEVNDQRLAAPFMIKEDEDVYIHAAYVRSNQDDRENVKMDLGPNEAFIKILEKGKFWYLEGRRVTTDYTAAIAFGLAGALLSSAMDKDYKSPVGIIYDTELEFFTLINTCDELKAYAVQHKTKAVISCDSKQVSPEEVRAYVQLINADY